MPLDPKEMLRVMRRVTAANNAATWEQHVVECEAWAKFVLEAADLLPWDGFVRIEDGKVVHVGNPWKEGGTTVGLLIDDVYGPESKERYAYNTLNYITYLDNAQVSQDMDGALRALHRLHAHMRWVQLKLEWEPDILLGRQVRAGGRKGYQKLVESQGAIWQQNYIEWQRLADSLVQQNPELSNKQILKRVGERVGRSWHTVRKHVRIHKTP